MCHVLQGTLYLAENVPAYKLIRHHCKALQKVNHRVFSNVLFYNSDARV